MSTASKRCTLQLSPALAAASRTSVNIDVPVGKGSAGIVLDTEAGETLRCAEHDEPPMQLRGLYDAGGGGRAPRVPLRRWPASPFLFGWRRVRCGCIALCTAEQLACASRGQVELAQPSRVFRGGPLASHDSAKGRGRPSVDGHRHLTAEDVLARASALRGWLRFFHIVDRVELDGGDRLALGRSRHPPPNRQVKMKDLNGDLFAPLR